MKFCKAWERLSIRQLPPYTRLPPRQRLTLSESGPKHPQNIRLTPIHIHQRLEPDFAPRSGSASQMGLVKIFQQPAAG